MLSWWLIPIAAVGGFDAAYILYKKQRHEKLVCLIGQDCEAVVNSRYSTFFGLPNEVIGLAYYLGIILAVGWTVAVGPTVVGVAVIDVVRWIAFAAAAASVVLTVIQAFILRQWCEYCLITTLVNLSLWAVVF
jgi:uncharacterized membrane protein